MNHSDAFTVSTNSQQIIISIYIGNVCEITRIRITLTVKKYFHIQYDCAGGGLKK